MEICKNRSLIRSYKQGKWGDNIMKKSSKEPDKKKHHLDDSRKWDYITNMNKRMSSLSIIVFIIISAFQRYKSTVKISCNLSCSLSLNLKSPIFMLICERGSLWCAGIQH